MLVHQILGGCPVCGGVSKFGNVWVRPDHVLRGCLHYQYSETVPLPPLRKKILYLDQCFFSHAFHAQDRRFVETADRIRQVSALQLLAVPFSSIHEDETNQWRGFDGKGKEALMKFIKATSRGHEFEPAYEVEETQITRAFMAFVSGGSTEFLFQVDDAVTAEIHAWDTYIRFDIGRYFGDVERMRDAKQQSVEALVDAFDHWRGSHETFQEQIALEMEEAASQYLRAYIIYAARVGTGDIEALFDSPLISGVVESLLHCLPQERIEDMLKKLGHFFRSEYYNQVPYLWLTARIYANLKGQVKCGAYTHREKAIKKLRGFYQDIKHVSTYAPYCDAFFMEKTMASIVADPRINLEGRYDVKVFTVETLPQLLAWVNDLEAGMSQEHRAALSAAYP